MTRHTTLSTSTFLHTTRGFSFFFFPVPQALRGVYCGVSPFVVSALLLITILMPGKFTTGKCGYDVRRDWSVLSLLLRYGVEMYPLKTRWRVVNSWASYPRSQEFRTVAFPRDRPRGDKWDSSPCSSSSRKALSLLLERTLSPLRRSFIVLSSWLPGGVFYIVVSISGRYILQHRWAI